MNVPPLKPLHDPRSLNQGKLDTFIKATTQELIESLKPGQPGSLKVKPDGTMMDGHHRIRVLMDRGIEVNSLLRETIE